MHIQSSSIIKTVYSSMFIQAFSRIFRHIQGYWSIFSHTCRCTTRGEGQPPLSFMQIKKSFLIFERNALIVSIFGLNFPLKNECPPRPLFLVFLVKSNLLPPCHEKFLVAQLQSGIILFAKRSILNVPQCFEYICQDKCSVICKMTLCYVLHQTLSEFWHIQYCFFQVCAGISNHIQRY